MASGFEVARSNSTRVQPPTSRSYNIPNDLWKTIWASQIPQKIKIFLRKACHNSIAVKHNLWRKRISPTGQCPVRNEAWETVDHLFFLFQWTRAVWFGSPLQWAVSSGGLGSLDIWLMQKIIALQSLSSDFSRDFSILACTLWSVWRGRNETVFKASRPSPVFTLQEVSSLLLTIDMSKQVKENIVREGNPQQNTRLADWIPPLGTTLKINVDASWVVTLPQASIGVIIRD